MLSTTTKHIGINCVELTRDFLCLQLVHATVILFLFAGLDSAAWLTDSPCSEAFAGWFTDGRFELMTAFGSAASAVTLSFLRDYREKKTSKGRSEMG